MEFHRETLLAFVMSVAPLIAQLVATRRSIGNPERVLVDPFADDLSLITGAKTDDIRRVKAIMEDFGEMTGLHLNEKKTVVMPVSATGLEANFGELWFSMGTSLKILGH